MKWLNKFSPIIINIALVFCAIYAWNYFYGSTPNRSLQLESGIAEYQILPKEAQHTYQLILKGGPFKYEQDGTSFGNHEKRLPEAQRGYYREYTVETPAFNHRGARRIVCGGVQKTKPDNCYYTQNHYKSFVQIRNAPTRYSDDPIK